MAARSDKPSISFRGAISAAIVGIENPTPAYNAIHDNTSQEKGFLYLSTVLDPTSRLTFISGVSNGSYQIPNNPGQTPAFTAFGVSNFNSSQLNERQNEFNQFNVLAYQKSGDGIDYQLSYFNRYSQLHFLPDTVGDLVFNGVASDVYRQSVVNGIQEDTSWRVGFAHTLKFGFSVSGEDTLVNNISTVLPLDAMGNPVDAPFSVFDSSAKTGWLFSTYLEDEWKITNQLTLNAGLRFDQMWQYVDANQLSPRINLTWKPYRRHHVPCRLLPKLHAAGSGAGGADQSGAGARTRRRSPRCRRTIRCSRNAPTCSMSAWSRKSTRYRASKSGSTATTRPRPTCSTTASSAQAYVLTRVQLCERTECRRRTQGELHQRQLPGLWQCRWAKQTATDVVSNQYLFDPDELAYIANNYVYTDHAQLLTASAGASYLWNGTRFSASMIYGSGLRDGFANTTTVPSYTQVNLGLSHDFNIVAANKPTTLRFDVVNLFDTIYEIRDGSGIGVFAPQYGPRRGFYFGISQKL